MGVLKCVTNNLLLFEVSTSSDTKSVRAWKVSSKSSRVFLAEQSVYDVEHMDKWKHSPAILLITGEEVVEKRLKKSDNSIEKITENNDLIWNLYSHEDSEEQTISFLRKEFIKDLSESFVRNKIYVLEEWICKNENPDREKLISDFYKKQFKLTDVRKNPLRANMLSLVAYYKLRLPMLLFFFIVLFANFLLNSRIRREYDEVQNELYLNQRKNRQQKDDQKKQGRIQAQYQSIPDRSLALIADRIASYIPPMILLNSLVVSPLEGTGSNLVSRNKELKFNHNFISIKGETEVPGGVSLLTQCLDSDHLFSSVKIQSLVKENDSSLFTFELNVELKP